MVSVIGTVLTTVATIVVPGVLVVLAIDPRVRWGRLAALAAPAGIVACFVLGEASLVTPIPVAPATWVVEVVLLGALAGWRLRTATDAPGWKERLPADLVPVALAAGGIVLGLGAWALALRGHAVAPANFDAGHHGYMVARIAATSSIEPDKVFATDVYGAGGQAYGFYPLGLHIPAALAHRVAGSVGRVLLVQMVLFAAVVLPLGSYLLARRLVPHRPLVAGFTALATPFVGLFPYKPSTWGGLALIAGMAMVPVAVVLALEALDDGRRDTAAFAGLGVGALLVTHSSEAFAAGGLVAIVVLAELLGPRRSRAAVVTLAKRAVPIAVAGLVPIVAALPGLVGGAGERATFTVNDIISPITANGALATLGIAMPHPQPLLVTLVLVGVAVALWRHELGPWIAALVLSSWLYLEVATSPSRIAEALSFPWYRTAERVGYNVVLVLTLFLGVALEAASGVVARLPRIRPRLAALGVGGVAVLLSGVLGLWVTVRDLRAAYRSYALVDTEQLAAWDYLADHAPSGSRVLNQIGYDGSLWMYAAAGVAPLFGVNAPVTDDQDDFQERVWLVQHIGDLGRDPEVDRLLDQWDVQYVYVDDVTFAGSAPLLHSDELAEVDGLDEVFTAGPAHVFHVRPNDHR